MVKGGTPGGQHGDLHTLTVNFVKHEKLCSRCSLDEARAVHCDTVCYLANLPLGNVINGWVVLGAVVAKVRGAWGPEITKLAL